MRRLYAWLNRARNAFERTVGVDLDGDGDVGREGDAAKSKKSSLARRAVLSSEWGKAVYVHWRDRFYFAWTTWLPFATLILTSRCMQVLT